MKLTRRQSIALAGAAAASAALPRAAAADAHATVHEVQMLNSATEGRDRNVFEPALVRAQPGDTIRFISTDRGHNSQSNSDMLPEGAEEWKSDISEDFEITLDVDGTYGYYCTPHRGTGMVGLILVGEIDEAQYQAAKDARKQGRARQRYEDIFAQADELLASESS
ncbi:pseudoazurin [Jannaschia ovalis]|uniref:Pseudoazurin n=1 Tax=Jannaschia ovalis TaxID=3038773 RepID=A0ABY8LG18_9RHOB|nr:pseudoazurin [Jannaschia sp. GRR-S6-38]WGH80245.1 pseudoazurin [Jannaschia sp. GRR-S6-38]